MRNDWPLTEKDVHAYRDLYYNHYKIYKSKNYTDHETQCKMTKVLAEHDWTWRRFLDYLSIDRMQRLVFEHSADLMLAGARSSPLTAKEDYKSYDPNNGALRLKDNNLSDDPDQFN